MNPETQGAKTDEATADAQEIHNLALEIADMLAPSALDSELVPLPAPHDDWFLLDSLDETTGLEECLRYCELRGLVHHHPEKPNLVRFQEPSANGGMESG